MHAPQPRLIYNGKVVILPLGAVTVEYDPAPPSTVNQSLTGRTETILLPRVDNTIRAVFELNSGNATSVDDLREFRMLLGNFYQWAKHGEPFALALDPDDTVYTTLTTNAAAGDDMVSLDDASAVVVGGHYAIIHGPNFQEVRVESFGSGSEVNIYPTLDWAFSSGARFRSMWYWRGVLKDPRVRSPIRNESGRDAPAGHGRPEWFRFVLDFQETDAVVTSPDEGLGSFSARIFLGSTFSAESSGSGEETGSFSAGLGLGASFVSVTSQLASMSSGLGLGFTTNGTTPGEGGGGQGFRSLFVFWQGGGAVEP